MSHIPVEILHLIFIQLDLKDKLECMRVCRSWHSTLDQRSLLYTLCISYRQFKRFKNIVERQSDRGTQVEKLVINVNSDFDKRKLCNMFPNLRELYLKNGSLESIWDQKYLNTKFDFIYPTTKLVRIEDFGHCELVRQLAMSDLVRHVNYLSLDLSCLPASTATNIFSQLKNMPILRTLHLYDIKVKLMDLEILHSNLGSLKSLHMDSSYLCTGEIPQNVTPAILVTDLFYVIEEVDDLHTHVEFYKYIHKKYPSVSSPEGCDIPLPKEDDDYLHQTCLNYLELTSVDLTRDLVKIIETIFPKLSTLTLKGYLKSNLEISLPNHNLEKVSISTEAPNEPCHGFVVKTTNDDKLQYHAPRKNPGRFPYGYQVIPVTKEEFDTSFVLNFTCASVKELILAIH